MSKRQSVTVIATVDAAQPLPPKRVRRATKRYAEGWFAGRLPRLSLALGVGLADGEDADSAGGRDGAVTSDGHEPLAI